MLVYYAGQRMKTYKKNAWTAAMLCKKGNISAKIFNFLLFVLTENYLSNLEMETCKKKIINSFLPHFIKFSKRVFY